MVVFTVVVVVVAKLSTHSHWTHKFNAKLDGHAILLTVEVIGSQADFPLQAVFICIKVSYELHAVGAPL